MQIILTKHAEKDLTQTAHYTLSKFGLLQAEKYYQGLTNALNRLGQHPSLGTEYSKAKKD
jgi:plasmid stabilization system protein ParE